jgi:hypothetical protein
MTAIARGCLGGAFLLFAAAAAMAQEAKSVALAKQLAAALDAAKLDSIAAKDPAAPDQFVGALYFPGAQLLVVSARYSAPILLVEKIAKKEYRDIYIDLNSASIPASKVFVQDLGADGLKAKRDENQPYDIYEVGDKRTLFDGDWKKQKLSEQDYMSAFSAADSQYAQMLTTLLAQLKKTS